MPERRPVYWDFFTGQIKEIQDSDTLPPALGGGASTFVDLTDTPNSYASQGGKYVRVNTGENALEFVNPPSGSGDVTGPASSTNNNIVLFDGVTGKAIKDSGVALSSKADATHTHAISDVTGLQTALDGKAASSHTHAAGDITSGTIATARLGSGTANSSTFLRGDQTWQSVPTNLDGLSDVVLSDPGSGKYLRHNGTNWVDAVIPAADLPTAINAANIADGSVSNTEFQYLDGVTSAIQTQINGKANTSHTHAISDVTGLQTALDGKQATLTNGFGITGTTTKAVSLTTAEAFCTAETTLTSASYADITGASITLAAGTWVILATINGSSQTTTATVLNAAITTAANAIVAEGAQHIVAGTATVRTWGNVHLSAIVSPGVETTYKLRGARGNTTQTGNCIVSDGIGTATANNVSNNSDKSTSIRAFRIA